MITYRELIGELYIFFFVAYYKKFSDIGSSFEKIKP